MTVEPVFGFSPITAAEAYLAEVERWDGRLRMRHCRGHRDGTGRGREDRCPEGLANRST